MKKTAILFLLVAAMASCNDAANNDAANAPKADSTPVATAPPAETPAPPMDSATMMKKMMDYATPGEMHKMLAASDGKWTTTSTMWMDPAAPPSTSTGSCENKMILGGRYQQSVHKGNMGGMPFEGISTVGYDNSKKKFISTWVDNMGTGIMHMEGTYDAATKTMNMSGKMVDCTTDKECDVRETYKIIDDKNHQMEMFVTSPGKPEFKTMEIKFTKK